LKEKLHALIKCKCASGVFRPADSRPSTTTFFKFLRRANSIYSKENQFGHTPEQILCPQGSHCRSHEGMKDIWRPWQHAGSIRRTPRRLAKEGRTAEEISQ
jgi:hypothetical protein